MATALEREGLKFFNGYHTISFHADRPALDDRLRGQIDAMKDHGTALWLAVARVQDAGRTFPNSSPPPPHSPTPVPALTVSGAPGAKANSLHK